MLAQLDLNSIQTNGLPGATFGPNSKLADIIGAVLPYVFGGAGIALLIYLVVGGLQMMVSRGDPKAMQGAQGKITNALLGFVIVTVSFLLVKLIGQLLGIDAFRPIFGF